jgi:hypothetical protein
MGWKVTACRPGLPAYSRGDLKGYTSLAASADSFYFSLHFMKKVLSILASCVLVNLAEAQTLNPATTTTGLSVLPAPTPYTVVSRDANSAVWQRTTYDRGVPTAQLLRTSIALWNWPPALLTLTNKCERFGASGLKD